MSKKFVCILSSKQKDLMTKRLITEHVEYLRALKRKNKLPFCGPCVDGTAIMILSAETIAEAKELLENDPFSAINYYSDRKIIEVLEANEENNFHLESVMSRL